MGARTKHMKQIKSYFEAQGLTCFKSGDTLHVELGYNLWMIIDGGAGKFVRVRNELRGFNMVSGLLQLSLERSLIYNSSLLVFYALYSIFINLFEELYRLPLEVIICACTIVIAWYIFYFMTFYHHKAEVSSIISKHNKLMAAVPARGEMV